MKELVKGVCVKRYGEIRDGRISEGSMCMCVCM